MFICLGVTLGYTGMQVTTEVTIELTNNQVKRNLKVRGLIGLLQKTPTTGVMRIFRNGSVWHEGVGKDNEFRGNRRVVFRVQLLIIITVIEVE